MKDNDIEDMLDLTFTVNEEVFGQVRLVPDLIPFDESALKDSLSSTCDGFRLQRES